MTFEEDFPSLRNRNNIWYFNYKERKNKHTYFSKKDIISFCLDKEITRQKIIKVLHPMYVNILLKELGLDEK